MNTTCPDCGIEAETPISREETDLPLKEEAQPTQVNILIRPEKGSRRRALTRRLRQVMHDALASQLPELAVPAPGAELLAVVFLQL